MTHGAVDVLQNLTSVSWSIAQEILDFFTNAWSSLQRPPSVLVVVSFQEPYCRCCAPGPNVALVVLP